MTKIIMALSLLLAHPADARGFPVVGEQVTWDTGVICLEGRAGKPCDEYEATLTIWNVNGEFCGSVNETSAWKSPDVWFRGRPFNEGILVRYVDSFQYEPDAYGWAVINVRGKHLSWTVLTAPEGGYNASETRFRLKNDSQGSEDMAGSCDGLEEGLSGLTVHLPPHAEGLSH